MKRGQFTEVQIMGMLKAEEASTIASTIAGCRLCWVVAEYAMPLALSTNHNTKEEKHVKILLINGASLRKP
ncbi:MAG: hypothetical protein H0U76_26530 [Ktedonobacteraceae bacterium]|nr:hypothetical protein [Ktedonobacteraceae bacterium]